jgi:protein Mpv17
MNIFTRSLIKYDHHLNNSPILTKSLSAATIGAFGDVICQLIVDNRTSSTYDVRRTVKMFALGLPAGPIFHHWLNFLNNFKLIKPLQAKSRALYATAQMFIDQTVFSPALNTFTFFTLGLYQYRGNIERAKQFLNQKLWPTQFMSWRIWPAAMVVNFYLIPLQYRVLFGNFIGLFWNVFFTF